MNTMLADVQPLNTNVKESSSRSDLSNNESKGDKFSSVLSREMRQERDTSTQTEHQQVTENKELNSNPGRVSKVADGSISDFEMPVVWLQDFTDQALDITTEAPVQPVEVVIDEILLSSATNASESDVPVMHIGLVPSGETLPVGGKPLPPAGAQISDEVAISMSALGADSQSAKSDLLRQSKLPQLIADSDTGLLAGFKELSASAVKPNGLSEASQLKAGDFQMMQPAVAEASQLKAGDFQMMQPAVAEASQLKASDFQVMQPAVAEVAELNGSQARLPNPSALVSAGNNPQNSLLLPTELETLTLNNTRDTTAWGNGVGERVHWMINQKLNTATIRLDPPSLGRLEVNIQVSDDVTKVTINTQHAQTRDIIDNASFKLREFLQENGYQNVSVDVSHQEQQQQASQQTGGDSGESLTDNQSNQDGVGENEGNEMRYFSSDSVVDLFA